MSYVEILLDMIDEIEVNKKEILNNIKQLINELKLNNIHQYFYLYCYLLWNGFFSYTHNHKYSLTTDGLLDNKIEEENYIYLGIGVCRHYTKLLNDILITFNICSKEIEYTLLDSSINPIMDIKRNVDSSCIDSNNNSINHKSVIVKDNNEVYILDPTNICEQAIIKDKKIYSFSGNYNVDYNNFINTLNIIYGNIKYPEKSTLTKKELINIYQMMKELCLTKKNLLEDFYINNKKYYVKQKELISNFEL